MPAFMSARPNSEYSRHIFLNTYVLCHTSACIKPSVIVWDLETVPDLGGFAAANR
jgi:hypothetical protein